MTRAATTIIAGRGARGATSMARKNEAELSGYDWTEATRGKYAAKARRSLEVIVIDKKTAKVLGGPEAIARILQALAEAIQSPRKKKKRRAA
jgi:hypothetical protein